MKEYQIDNKLAEVLSGNGLVELAPKNGHRRFMNALNPSDFVTFQDGLLLCNQLGAEPGPIPEERLKVIIAFHKLHPKTQKELVAFAGNRLDDIIKFLNQAHKPDTVPAIFKKDLADEIDKIYNSVFL
ncbi:hypothetical protein [Adhaeribacter aquaticus]|uniref:hypothetical protein n=1 Tax=Adhaeribacter aquaticus TaxID=299567 RepID=UPI0003FF562D|nr:hypothetical protein [Adhaeribacter aquaticus]